VVFYGKQTPDGRDRILVAVNMDPFAPHTSMVDVPLATLGIAPDQPYRMHELLTDQTWEWRGPRGYVELDPAVAPAQIFAVEPA
jgi:starch synthase (maltosyl-transferring)